jgi:hypothetical protein
MLAHLARLSLLFLTASTFDHQEFPNAQHLSTPAGWLICVE